MGTFIHTLGNLNIPKDKQEAFIADAKIIAEKGGLFSQSYTSIFGSRLWLLSFPDPPSVIIRRRAVRPGPSVQRPRVPSHWREPLSSQLGRTAFSGLKAAYGARRK